MGSKIHAAHILVKTEQEANIALYDLQHGKNFEDIAREKSICSSARKGGDLGFFGKGQMAKEFEQAAFAMKAGQISKPIKTQFGWHIIKVL